ncbi:hypothetical protein [Roseivirga seohaensis]|uniref:hypothetical protein n=1 Tax=Roseivirga seohaensis TaxID=1914963 RepID=UPI003BACEC31
MKIFKRPDHIIFDTKNPNKMEFKHIHINDLKKPLHQTHMQNDWDFLAQHFKQQEGTEHPIFKNFATSYYYVIEA